MITADTDSMPCSDGHDSVVQLYILWSVTLKKKRWRPNILSVNILIFNFFPQKRCKGQAILDKVCQHLDLMEKDYFGLVYKDNQDARVSQMWCDLNSSNHTVDVMWWLKF